MSTSEHAQGATVRNYVALAQRKAVLISPLYKHTNQQACFIG